MTKFVYILFRFDDMFQRITYINRIMNHNFGIIMDLNFHYLYEERSYQDCVRAKKENIVWKATKFVLNTIGMSIALVLMVIATSIWPIFIGLVLALVGTICWPATAVIVGTVAAIYLTIKVVEGFNLYHTQKPYYISPIEKNKHLIKRNKKPFGSKLTDIFRG